MAAPPSNTLPKTGALDVDADVPTKFAGDGGRRRDRDTLDQFSRIFFPRKITPGTNVMIF
jgi:hypothetical protein